jgi:hypothetical protein
MRFLAGCLASRWGLRSVGPMIYSRRYTSRTILSCIEALAAWAQARPRTSGSRLALYHVCVNTAGCTPRLQWGSVVAWSSTAVTTGFVRGHRAPVTTNNRRILQRKFRSPAAPQCGYPQLAQPDVPAIMRLGWSLVPISH